MKITPLDIQKHEFPTVRKGYDVDEVRDFLLIISEEFEGALTDLMDLRDQVSSLSEECQEFKNREKILKNTLLTAQKMSQEVKENASKEANLIVKEAELKADRIISQAQVRATKIEASITELKIQKNQMRMRVKAALEQLQELLKFQETEDVQNEKIRFMRKTEDLIGKDAEKKSQR